MSSINLTIDYKVFEERVVREAIFMLDGTSASLKSLLVLCLHMVFDFLDTLVAIGDSTGQ